MGYLYVLATILLTVYGQLIFKYRIAAYAPFPEATLERLLFLFRLIFDPLIFSGFVAAFLAALFWMAALTKFDLSYAYPFMSLSFVLVFVASAFLLNESIDAYKIGGLVLIVAGIVVSSRSI